MPRPRVGIELLNHGLLLVVALRPRAGTRHGGAEEDVYDEHQEKENPEDDAEVEEPRRVHGGGGGGQAVVVHAKAVAWKRREMENRE